MWDESRCRRSAVRTGLDSTVMLPVTTERRIPILGAVTATNEGFDGSIGARSPGGSETSSRPTSGQGPTSPDRGVGTQRRPVGP